MLKKMLFMLMVIFQIIQSCQVYLIVEAFGQAAAALTAHGIDKKEYENKLVFLMSVEKARFRNPVIPDCKLELKIEAIRSHGRVWKYKGEAFVDGKRMADAQWSATIVDKNN
jgi:3-hydroxyacyl-[acyl-carrier-protein] dehydratase